MLLLFWKALGFLAGLPISIKWYHSPSYPPRCIIAGPEGASVANPFLYETATTNECAFATFGHQCNCADVYSGNLVLGTEDAGLYKLPWTSIIQESCNVLVPRNLSSLAETFVDFNGLLSNRVISIEANNEYLGVVTDAGFCYGKSGDADFITYSTESGKDCFVCQNGTAYFAEGDRILAKGAPTDFTTWETEYNLGKDINDIWVVERDGIDTVFIATVSGLAVIEQGQEFYYGDKNYSQIKAEVGSSFNHGHVFAVSSGTVDIINLQHKQLENTITYSGLAILAYENKRIYSK
jgi:hypothetical protein